MNLEEHTPESELQHSEPEPSPPSGGMGKMLVAFFAVAALCAIFFGLGYKMGRDSAPQEAAPISSTAPPASSPAKPSAVVPESNSAPSSSDGSPRSDSSTPASTPAESAPGRPQAASIPPARSSAAAKPVPAGSGNFAVQVAAVSKEEDADALVNALRTKNYPVFVVNGGPSDKLYHVQVGPFTSIADAENMRSKLAADGYNPILKK